MEIREDEKYCYEAIINHYEKQTGEKRKNVYFPEFTKDEPPVDLCFTLGDEKFAIEHTFIEPFKDEIRKWKRKEGIHRSGEFRFLPEEESSDETSSFHDIVKKAIEKKSPKLSEFKKQGAHTVLLLAKEDVLKDSFEVRKVIRETYIRSPDYIQPPDDIYCIYTNQRLKTNNIYPLRVDGRFLSEDELRFELDGLTPKPIREFSKTGHEAHTDGPG